jgi:twitching motility protein PilT
MMGGRRGLLDIQQLLKILVQRQGSDLHLVAGSSPLIRLDGDLTRLTGPQITADDMNRVADTILPADRRLALERLNEADFAYSLPGVGRFRVNLFRQRGSVSVVMRLVRVGSAGFEELDIPPIVRDLASAPRGLVLVTGPTGSGKTTTLAAMVDWINAHKPVHILTIEDPIEVIHPHKLASVNQRELGVDTDSYVAAMRAAMRQDPDVILIGEMRDTDTVSAALAAAETGHLVLSTLHTTDAVETVNRVVDFFPPYQQHQVRVTLASVLRGVVGQRLVQRRGGGRVPILEIMVNNGRITERIVDSTRTDEIADIIAEGSFYGMMTFDQSLLRAVVNGVVSVETARDAATSLHDFELMLEKASPPPAAPAYSNEEAPAPVEEPGEADVAEERGTLIRPGPPGGSVFSGRPNSS